MPLLAYAYADANGAAFWLIVAAVCLAAEVIGGRGWAIWGAFGAGVAAALTAWLNLNLGLEALAFIAATALGVLYRLRARTT
jgi:membrane protein implicated in regulation of membrane protease activity